MLAQVALGQYPSPPQVPLMGPALSPAALEAVKAQALQVAKSRFNIPNPDRQLRDVLEPLPHLQREVVADYIISMGADIAFVDEAMRNFRAIASGQRTARRTLWLLVGGGVIGLSAIIGGIVWWRRK